MANFIYTVTADRGAKRCEGLVWAHETPTHRPSASGAKKAFGSGALLILIIVYIEDNDLLAGNISRSSYSTLQLVCV